MGKSLNLSMLKRFLDNKETNSELYYGLKIYKYTDFIENYHNSHPVLNLSFPKDFKKPKTY